MKFVLSEHILAQMFLRKEAIARTRIGNGETFLMQAVDMRPETGKLLMQSGADVNAKDDSGMTAFRYIAKFCNARLVKALLGHGTDPKTKDRRTLRPTIPNSNQLSAGLGTFEGGASAP